MIRFVTVAHAVIPMPVERQISLDADILAGLNDVRKSGDPVKTVVLNSRERGPHRLSPRINAGQFLVGAICIDKAIINRFSRGVINHFVIGHADGAFLKQGPELPLHFLQRRVSTRQLLQKTVERSHQLTDFVLPHYRQALHGLPGIRHGGQCVDGVEHGRQLAPQHPPGRCPGQNGQHQSDHQHALLHITDRRKGFFGGQCSRQIPSGPRNLLDGLQHLLALRVDVNQRTFLSVQKAIDHGNFAARRARFHDPGRVGPRNDHPVLCGNQQEAPCLPVMVSRQMTKEIRSLQMYDPRQGADHVAVIIANRYGHQERRGTQGFPDGGPTDRRFPLSVCGDHGIAVRVVDPDLSQHGHSGNSRVIRPVDDEPPIEKAGKRRLPFKRGLQHLAMPHMVGERSRCPLQRFITEGQIGLDRGRHGGYRRKLLLTQHALHVLAQHLAGEEGKGPQDEQKNTQHTQGNSRLKRTGESRGGGHSMSLFVRSGNRDQLNGRRPPIQSQYRRAT